jgi:putative PIN family toxin of toxin-antitoxin system
MKVVIDVNVWISGLLWGGLPGDVIRLVRGGQLISYVSSELELELTTTLNRQKFQARLQHLAANSKASGSNCFKPIHTSKNCSNQ